MNQKVIVLYRPVPSRKFTTILSRPIQATTRYNFHYFTVPSRPVLQPFPANISKQYRPVPSRLLPAIIILANVLVERNGPVINKRGSCIRRGRDVTKRNHSAYVQKPEYDHERKKKTCDMHVSYTIRWSQPFISFWDCPFCFSYCCMYCLSESSF